MIFSKSEHQEIRKNFPVIKRYIFFNNAGVAPICLPAMKIIQTLARDICEHGFAKLKAWYIEAQKERNDVAALLNGSTDEIAFVKNTSHGLSLVAAGLDWHAGDEIIIADQEFPANVYPWLNLKKKGVKVVTVRSKNGKLPVSGFEKAITSKTKLISVSSVEYSTGFKNDLGAIGKLCRKCGIFFCVDAIQSLGAIPMDVKKFKIDFLAADGHKWLVAPEGVGIFYCRKPLMRKLDLTLVGWNTVRGAHTFHEINFQPKNNAERFEEGSPNLLGILALTASIRFLQSAGIERIEQWNLHLADLLLEGLKGRGLKVLSPTAPEERSAIVSFTTGKKKKDKSLVDYLIKKNIILSMRADGIRLSPHLYNSPAEIAKFFKILELYL